MRKLGCPECGGQGLATLEQLEGLCLSDFTVDEVDVVHSEPHGYTEILWDTSTTIGVVCRECDWSSNHPEWAAQLAVVVEVKGLA
jgi:hypothetical protein